MAKHVFQVYGADAIKRAVLKKRLRPNQVMDFFAIVRIASSEIEAARGARTQRAIRDLVSELGAANN